MTKANPVLRLHAPAKLNLFLHIVGRRDDGYHLLQSAFQLIDLCDVLTLQASDDSAISRTGGLEGLPADEDLSVRAACALQDATGCRRGAQIHIDKHIPAGAGLGGGSSDAAAVLLGLDALWGTQLSTQALCEIGAELGADVPFFVAGRNAWVEGIGEQLTPIALAPAWFVVITPRVEVPTAAIFAHPKLTRHHPVMTIPASDSPLAPHALVASGTNSCEPVVRELFKEVAQAFDIHEDVPGLRMTGTGASVFACTATRDDAEAVAAHARHARNQVAVCRGLSRSPVHLAVAQAFESRFQHNDGV